MKREDTKSQTFIMLPKMAANGIRTHARTKTIRALEWRSRQSLNAGRLHISNISLSAKAVCWSQYPQWFDLTTVGNVAEKVKAGRTYGDVWSRSRDLIGSTSTLVASRWCILG